MQNQDYQIIHFHEKIVKTVSFAIYKTLYTKDYEDKLKAVMGDQPKADLLLLGKYILNYLIKYTFKNTFHNPSPVHAIELNELKIL